MLISIGFLTGGFVLINKWGKSTSHFLPAASKFIVPVPCSTGADASRRARRDAEVTLHYLVRDRAPAAVVVLPVGHVLLAYRVFGIPHPLPRRIARAGRRERICECTRGRVNVSSDWIRVSERTMSDEDWFVLLLNTRIIKC